MTIVQVQVSIDDEELAHVLARRLLDERLVACAQVLGPMTSHYRWQGMVETAREWLVVLKTEADRADALVAELSRVHPAENPEILVLPVAGGAPDYLAWVRAETRPAP